METYLHYTDKVFVAVTIREDYYIDVSQIFHVSGVKCSHYYSLEETQDHLLGISIVSGIPVEELLEICEPYIWVHKDVWRHLAYWMAPLLDSQMNEWIGHLDARLIEKERDDVENIGIQLGSISL